MAQAAFDHSFNMLADPAYADRCHRKKILRRRKTPKGDYQINEDVWARHPNDNIMYIASIIGIDQHHNTCRIAFVHDGQTFTLPINHLRHVTREDIKRNRYVDYEEGWSERGNYGSINVYDRYGELQETHFPGTSKRQDINNDFFMNEDNMGINDHKLDTLSLNAITEGNGYANSFTDLLETEVFWVRIPDPEEPTSSYCYCPIWIASSYAEAETKAMELINQDVDYLEAVERATHRTKVSKQHDLLCSDEANVPEARVSLSRMKSQISECGTHSPVTESPTWQFQSSIVLTDHQSIESMNELEHILTCQEGIDSQLTENDSSTDQSLSEVIDRADIPDIHTVKVMGTQTNSSPTLSTLTVDSKFKPITLVCYDQPADVVLPLRKSTKRTSNRLFKSGHRIRREIVAIGTYLLDEQQKFWSHVYTNNLFKYASTKYILHILLIALIVYQLSTRSTFSEKNVDLIPTMDGQTISSTILVLMAALISFSSSTKGPGRSMFELWFYPFAVP